MIDWIFEGIANWVASIMTQVMDAVHGLGLQNSTGRHAL